MPFIAIVLVIAAALGGGAAVAAQGSLPGDLLWGFKVHINEDVQGALNLTDKDKANWDISTIETRLTEAQTLTAQSRLTVKEESEIESNFDTHVQDVTRDITKLESRGDAPGAADVAARFQATMADRAATLSDTQVKASAAVQAALTPLLIKVRATLDDASNLSADASAKVSL